MAGKKGYSVHAGGFKLIDPDGKVISEQGPLMWHELDYEGVVDMEDTVVKPNYDDLVERGLAKGRERVKLLKAAGEQAKNP